MTRGIVRERGRLVEGRGIRHAGQIPFGVVAEGSRVIQRIGNRHYLIKSRLVDEGWLPLLTINPVGMFCAATTSFGVVKATKLTIGRQSVLPL